MNLRDTGILPALRVIVIGAGFGGLASALRLRALGHHVTLLERHDWVGGKARTVESVAGPVYAGPTVLTLRRVFDEVFRATGAPLEDYATLIEEPILARHFWPDGSRLDLFSDRAASVEAVHQFAGSGAAREFRTFAQQAERLFDTFDAPMMQAASPSVVELGRAAVGSPKSLAALSPLATLAGSLAARFSDPRLRQLFGRYATYVGGSPYEAPALLTLIWRAEEAGVWRVGGGMHGLAEAMAARFAEMGGDVRFGAGVERISVCEGRATGVILESGDTLEADCVVFNGDPRALATGAMGLEIMSVGAVTRTAPRSLSASVWSFAAKHFGVDLAHHNVFFADEARSEFDDLKAGRVPRNPSIYVCAEDRGDGLVPPDVERFEIIVNAPPLTRKRAGEGEELACRHAIFRTLERFGLSFDPEPEEMATPETFERLFPGSAGALYGQSPHGVTAALKRPRARTAVPGLYLAGGGAHPGAGVPMAALSGQHAAEAITQDLVLT